MNVGVAGASDATSGFTLLNELNDSIVVADGVFDPPGPRILYANDACAAACGRSRAQLLGAPLAELYADLQRPRKLTTLERFCQNNRSCKRAGTLTRSDGTALPVRWHITPVFQGADIDHLICLVVDEVESTDKAGALQAGERRFLNLFEHGLIGKAILIRDGRFADVNQSFCDLTGYGKAELIGAHSGIVLRERDRKAVGDRIRRIFEGEDTGYQIEGRYVHKQGHEITALVDVVPDTDEQGIVQVLIVQVQDISDWKATEAGLREGEGRLRHFAEIAADWFWETDEDLLINYVSSAHRQITGIPDEQIIGRTREDLFRDKLYKAADAGIHLRTLDNRWDSTIEYSVIREDGSEITVHDRASPFFDQTGRFKGYRGIGRDVSEQKRLTRRIAYQATRDPLTGALNRREFERNLDEAVAEARRGGREHVLCFTDLDKFKLLNDTCGHPAGDYLLKKIVEMLQADISSDDLLGRMGGDEFAILLRDTDMQKAERLALQMSRSIKTCEFRWEDRTFNIGMSMGLVPLNCQTNSTSELLARADTACYRAKEESDNRIWISDENEAARLRTYTDTLRTLSSSSAQLSKNFQLVGQPIRPLYQSRDCPLWYEVLLRLVGEDDHYYRPYDFIRLAEQYGKMAMIEQWIIETAVAEHAVLVRAAPQALLSINLAGTSLADERLLGLMARLLDEHAVSPANLCFEIRERTALNDFEHTIALVESLAKKGYWVALDEFGSGPSSFTCLKHLPVHYLKLYGELVRAVPLHETDIAIIESINKLSDRLDLTLVAVQVETQQTADTLQHIGVEFGQGDALASTRPLEQLVSELLHQGA